MNPPEERSCLRRRRFDAHEVGRSSSLPILPTGVSWRPRRGRTSEASATGQARWLGAPQSPGPPVSLLWSSPPLCPSWRKHWWAPAVRILRPSPLCPHCASAGLLHPPSPPSPGGHSCHGPHSTESPRRGPVTLNMTAPFEVFLSRHRGGHMAHCHLQPHQHRTWRPDHDGVGTG